MNTIAVKAGGLADRSVGRQKQGVRVEGRSCPGISFVFAGGKARDDEAVARIVQLVNDLNESRCK